MLSYKKVFIISASCFIVTIIFGFVAYQSIFEFIIRDVSSLFDFFLGMVIIKL
jgi:hypothetical protein